MGYYYYYYSTKAHEGPPPSSAHRAPANNEGYLLARDLGPISGFDVPLRGDTGMFP